MSTKPTLMVQIAEREWTLEALHCACVLARNTSARIALVKMIPVQHTSWLGTEWGYMHFSHQEQADFADYQATIEDYGVEFMPVVFQYATLPEAIAQAAEHIDAKIVYATIPESPIPFWTRYQQWSLNRQLSQQQRQWIRQPPYDPKTSIAEIQEVTKINWSAHHVR